MDFSKDIPGGDVRGGFNPQFFEEREALMANPGQYGLLESGLDSADEANVLKQRRDRSGKAFTSKNDVGGKFRFLSRKVSDSFNVYGIFEPAGEGDEEEVQENPLGAADYQAHVDAQQQASAPAVPAIPTA